MTRYSKDPQRMYNYWNSANTEMIALQPKFPYMVTSSMISKHQKQWDQASTKNYFYLLFDADPDMPGAMPKREAPPQISSAITAELARCEHDIDSSMGLYESFAGEASQERSGRAIVARQSRGSLGLYPFVDHFGMALTHSTRVLIGLIPFVYDTERVVRIIGEEDEELNVPLNASQPNLPGVSPNLPQNYVSPVREGITEFLNDLTVGKYDVVVTIGPSYATVREETTAMLVEMLKTMPPQVAVPMLELLIESMDLPKAEKMKKRIQQIINAPPQPDPKIEIEIQKLGMEMQKQIREDFLAHFKAMLMVAQSESMEAGQQVQQYEAIVDGYLREKEIEAQRAQQEQAQTGQQGATQ